WVRGRTVRLETVASPLRIIAVEAPVGSPDGRSRRRNSRMHRRLHRSWLPLPAAAFAVLVILQSLAGAADAASSQWQAKCAANIRVSPTTSAKVLRTIARGARVTTVGAVFGGHWSTGCDGGRSGNMWLKIIAINGRTTKSFFGRSVVYAARGLFKYVPPP